ncbi:MAG: N-methyl-L-tryptophan oxidase [Saprospiraceae bacterium]|nr:N-methyl-L-tryptophan oxidase [Saprospiraceae bacterium]
MNHLYDCIIVGGGSMGSAAAYHLSKNGQKVLLLEQFDFIHEQGAHGGQSRLIRKAYFEHPDYVPLLLRAYKNWAALEKETQEQVYFETGILYFGEKNEPSLANIRQSAQLNDLRLTTLSMTDAKQKYPMFAAVPDDWESLLEPEAGFLLVEKCVHLHLQLAIKHGARLLAREKVIKWTENTEGVVVVTEKQEYHAKKVIFTAGAWTDKLLTHLNVPLKVTRQILGWVSPKNWDDFSLGKFPCWGIFDKEKSLYYGMPILNTEGTTGALGLKLGCHFHGAVVNPDSVDRDITEADEATFREGLKKYMPAANGDTLAIKTCLYTNSPDEHFIIDHYPKHKNVILTCGFSGHGFKFASVIGEILSDLAIHGKTKQPIGFLSLKRFGKMKKSNFSNA